MKKVILCSLVSILLSCCAFAASNYNYAQNQPDYGYDINANYAFSNLKGYAVYVPAGITCQALLSQGISSKSAVVGQNVDVVITEDFSYNGQIIAPAGSVIEGSIVSNQKAGIGNRNGRTMVKFTTIRTPYNNVIPISAVFLTDDNSGVLKGGTAKDSAKEYAKDVAVGAGSGAVFGTAMGALSSGSVGRGAIYGTAIGAGAGLIKTAAEKGTDVVIPSNSTINILFNQPITLSAQ